MLGFEIQTDADGEFIELYIEDEASVLVLMNQENMKRLEASLHNELLECHRIIRERGWD